MGIVSDCLKRWQPRRQGLLFLLSNMLSKLINKVYQMYPNYLKKISWNYLKKLGRKSVDRKRERTTIVIATPPFDRGTSPNNVFDSQLQQWLPCKIFQWKCFLVDLNVGAIHKNPPKYRHKLISFQSLNRAFEIQNQSSLKRFLYS